MAEYEKEALDFTDGDTFKRFSVNSVDCLATSVVGVSCQRGTFVTEQDDHGWTFHPTVVNVYAGGFDVNVTALVMGEPPIASEGPNELVTLAYTLY